MAFCVRSANFRTSSATTAKPRPCSPALAASIEAFKDNKLTEELTKVVDYIKTIYNIKYLWIMVYSPESKLSFHWDHGKDRHVISLNRDERFFNYENGDGQSKYNLYNEKLNEHKNDIDSFNEFFLKDSDHSTIHILDTKSVYVFGNSLHTFYNGSNKLRSALVFEIIQ